MSSQPSSPAAVQRGLSGAHGAPAIDAQGAFVADGEGRYRLEAPLTFATVPALRPVGLARIAASAGGLQLDLQRVSTADSAGLALLVDWLAEARAQQRTLSYAQVPEALRALARLSDVDSLIAPSDTAPAGSVNAAPVAARSP